MTVTTFLEEGLIDEQNLISKSLFILLFMSENEATKDQIRYHPDNRVLENMRTSPYLSRYCFIGLINPPGFNLVTRNLLHPARRTVLEKDFYVIQEFTLYEYIRLLNTISSTIALN